MYTQLPEPLETITVTSHTLSCDGGAASSRGALGHPLVYMTVGASGSVDCGYCGRRFILDSAAGDHGH